MIFCSLLVFVDLDPYHAVSLALEVIPRTLIQNCGVDPIRTLTALRVRPFKFLLFSIYLSFFRFWQNVDEVVFICPCVCVFVVLGKTLNSWQSYVGY
jgi:hypothetical protein